MRKVKSLLNKMSSPMRPPAGLGDLRLTKSFVSKVFSLFITTQSAEDSRQRPSGMTALLDVKAFTLVELLVVVLIIGILSAIAIPMYQGAVDKSHWSTMLPASKAIKDAEEAFKMTNGEYSDTMEHLDVQMNNSDLTFDLQTPNNLADPNVIRVTNSKLGDKVRLASYLDDSPLFAGQLHCEAKNEGSTPNERGQRLCEKLLNGQYLKTTDDGYTRYLLDQTVDGTICKDAQGSWSTSKNKCYNNTSERCSDLGMGVVTDEKYPDQCGYTSTDRKAIGAEGVCVGNAQSSCRWGSVEQGGTCIGNHYDTCYGLSSVKGTVDCSNHVNCGFWSTYDGGICVSSTTGSSCGGSTFKNGAICYANYQGVCENSGGTNTTYLDTSCCCGGDKCGAAPRCDESRCDPQYMK